MQSTSAKGAPTEATSRPAAVYRLWAGDGTLLYVGSSYDPERRCQGHRDKPWWPEVGKRTDEWKDSRGAAYRAELDAIFTEQPRHNVYGTGRETEALRRRAEMNRLRGAVQAEAYRIEEQAREEALSQGAPWREAYGTGMQALISFLDDSGVFPAWVERLRKQGRPA